jgi:hypothetical protein
MEALRILANTLVLHAAGRNRFAKAGGAKAIAKALAGKDGDGDYTEIEEEENVDRVFLLARIGFLVTLDRKGAVGVMEREDVVDSLVYVRLASRAAQSFGSPFEKIPRVRCG